MNITRQPFQPILSGLMVAGLSRPTPSKGKPETRAKAFCHYHLTIEGILAQTAYYIMSACYDDSEFERLPNLPGLAESLLQLAEFQFFE